MHQCPEHWVAIGHAVVYYARAAHALSEGIKCPCCMHLCLHKKYQRIKQNEKIRLSSNQIYVLVLYIIAIVRCIKDQSNFANFCLNRYLS